MTERVSLDFLGFRGVPLNLRVKLMSQHNKKIEAKEKKRLKERKQRMLKKILRFMFTERFYRVDDI